MAGKFIVLSDIHLNLWSYGDPHTRLDEQIAAIRTTLQAAVDENVDAVLWPGDIFHAQGAVQTEILSRLYTVLKEYDLLACKTVFVPGNHDMVYRQDSSVHALDFLSQFGRVPSYNGMHLYWRPIEVANMPTINAIPYHDDYEALVEEIGELRHREGCILLLHQGVKGDFLSKGFVLDEALTGADIPDDVFHAFAGHCHSFQRSSKKLTVPGALMQHHFGDAGDPRGYLLVDYWDDKMQIRHVEVPFTQFVNISYQPDLKLLKEECMAKADAYVRITGVPVVRLEEVRRMSESYVRRYDPKIITRPEHEVPVKVESSEIGDLRKLFDRFVEHNQLTPDVVAVGKQIMEGVDGVS